MFCPEGYVVMHRLEALFHERSMQLFPDLLLDDSADDMTRDERAYNFNREKRANQRDEAIGRFLRSCPSLSVCTLSGAIFRISPSIATWEPSRSIKTYKGFWFLSRPAWLVDADKPARWLDHAKTDIERYNYILPLLNRHGMTRKASASKERQNTLISATIRLLPLVEAFKPFNGCAITILEADAPKSASDTSVFFEAHPSDEDDYLVPRIGRPSKQAVALASYWKIFPEGHKEATWKEVTRLVSADIRMAIGADTLRRALGLRK